MKLKQLALVSLISLSSMITLAQAKKKSPVDGRIYAIVLTEDNKKKTEVKDDVSFLAGKFKSNFMVLEGFQQADYEYEVDTTSGKPVIKFTVESKTADQERFSWEGVIEGDNVTGTAIVRKKGKIVHSFTFTGTHKNKKKVKPAPKAVVAPKADSIKTDSIKAE
jgi:hypothetical protein